MRKNRILLENYFVLGDLEAPFKTCTGRLIHNAIMRTS